MNKTPQTTNKKTQKDGKLKRWTTFQEYRPFGQPKRKWFWRISKLQTFQASNFYTIGFPALQPLVSAWNPGSKARELLAREVAEVDGMDFFFWKTCLQNTFFRRNFSLNFWKKTNIFVFFSLISKVCFFPRYVWGAGFPDRTLWWPGAGRGNPGGPRQVVSCWMDGFFHTTSWGWFIPLLTGF